VTLRLTNTLTRRIEAFQPLEPGKVSIYCCGVTVYDLCHLAMRAATSPGTYSAAT